MKRLLQLSLFIFASGCFIFSTDPEKPRKDKRPNFIIILADDLGYSDIGCYGSEIATPNIDRLAKDGLRFTKFYNTSRCCPTRASLLTGLYNQQAGIGEMTTDLGLPGYRGHITKNAVTIAEVLKQSGYRTGMVGKWHVSNTIEQKTPEQQLDWLNHKSVKPLFSPIEQYPTSRGFEKYYGNIWGVVDFFDPFSLVNGTTPVTSVPENYYHTDALNDSAVSYIREFVKEEKPFFLYLAHTAPHWPLHALPEDIEKYKDTYKVGWDKIRESRYKKMTELGIIDPSKAPLSPRWNDNLSWENNPDKDWDARAMAVHAAMIDRMDQGIGRILDELKRNGELENTFIVFLSDNGASYENAAQYGPGFDRPNQTRDGKEIHYPVNKKIAAGPETSFSSIGQRWANVANTPYRLWKMESYEGGVNTPFIAYWPKGIKQKKGSFIQQPGHVMDLMPTVLELAGAKYPSEYDGNKITPVQGISLVPLLKGKKQEGHDVLFNEHYGAKSVRTTEWKLVAANGKPWELYRIEEDQTELNNVASKFPEVVKDLEEKWKKWAEENNVVKKKSEGYTNSRSPLKQNPYLELPLGSIKPKGWLKEMLLTQKNGATGKLDKLYPLVMGPRNGWLGGDGDQWERGPYWIDGLLPLAYILEDKELIAKTKPWIEWTLNSQQPDGYFGPSKDYPYERGIQRDNSRDWWPKMVMLKVMQQYYSATKDQRVIPFLTKYFKYQLNELPKNPLDKWTFWGRYRGGDNLAVVYWLYNLTGDKFLLDLADLIHKQTYDYTGEFLKGDLLTYFNSIHCVNLAQGFKEPLLYSQQHKDNKYTDATNKGLKDLRHFNGMAHGLYGGDEALHGNNPTQGSELCTAVEMMFSLENMLTISGSVSYAGQLEKIAFNALPTQMSDDFNTRQYYQQANQVQISREIRNFDQNHSGTDLCFGLLTGYACCTSNMHQGWPKFTQNLWYSTPDKGIAALVYSPSEVNAIVSDGIEINVKEETDYPFGESVKFKISHNSKKAVQFPFHLRIPEWCKKATIKVNNEIIREAEGNRIEIIEREWKTGDVIEFLLPMHIFKNNWYEGSVSVERGPLTYALKMGEEWKEIKNDRDPIEYGEKYYEVYPTTPWNYALVHTPSAKMNEAYQVTKKSSLAAYPWNSKNAPLEIRVKAKKIPSWKMYNGMTGPIPFSITNGMEAASETEEIVLIPYGCTTLRISQFPVVR